MSDSIITKKAIADTLKALCKTMPFRKISISNITEGCGLNRQTFYYHFQDKNELLSWIYYHEYFLPVAEGITFDNWTERIEELLNKMMADKAFFMNTVDEQEETFKKYLLEMSKALFCEAIEVLDQSHKLTEEEKEFDAEFYAYGVCGTIIQWVVKGMKIQPKVMATKLKSLVRSSEKAAVLYGSVNSEDE